MATQEVKKTPAKKKKGMKKNQKKQMTHQIKLKKNQKN